MINYFQLLNLHETFSLALEDIEDNYFQLQLKYHPDQVKSAEEKNKYLQISSNLNLAYKTLKCPYTRAEHILNLKGIDLTAPNLKSVISMDFLENIFSWQTRLNAINTVTELKKLQNILNVSYNNTITELRSLLASRNYEAATVKTMELKYLVNLINIANHRLRDASN